MARTASAGVNRRDAVSKPAAGSSAKERRIATPNRDLLVIQIGERYGKLEVLPKERASGVLARVAQVLAKPGADRARVFQSSSGKPVYAYSIDSTDTSKVVREDASGRQTIGRFVAGRFSATSSTKAV